MTRITRLVDGARRALLAALLTVAAAPTRAAATPEAFWHLLDQLATASAQGGQAVVRQWPGKPFSLSAAGPAAGIRSESIDIAPGLQSSIDEVRLSEGDTVRLLVLGLQGRCITPADVSARYPQVKNADFPQPNNPDPVRYRRVDMDGVRVSFGFRGALPGCLAHVVFNPAGD